LDSKVNGPIHTRIADALARLGTLARFDETQQAQAEGLSPLQARALVALRRRSPSRVGDLARELLVTDGTLSAAVSALEGKGLVTKRADPEEHRAVNLQLTRKGSAAARRAAGWAGAQLAPAMADLSEHEAGTLLALLLGLIRSFERRGAVAAARMCLTCGYFAPGGGAGARPLFGNLLEEPIGEIDLRVECPDHEPGEPEHLPELGHPT
jgi:DNA-binding MarR family transcriptional regulator